MKNKKNAFVGLGLSAILITTLSACTFNSGDSDKSNGMMGNPSTTTGASNSSNFSPSDIMFAQMMIPHHQQAVEMSTLAETRASSAEVKKLAAQIKAEQAPEIAQMTKWLTDSNSPTSMGHDMGMNGMLDDDQMRALEAASGAEFDRLYLQGMIEHHKGAIQMAQMVINSSNAEAKVLGTAIVDSQSKQIQYMESLLSK
jgi:uncharacterized protein (DUF305 family)